MAKLKLSIVLAACALACAGCWPWGREASTPQQQFIDALNRGDGAQATQIWLHMNGEQRAALASGRGIKPQLSENQARQQITAHVAEKMGASEEPGGETIEVPRAEPAGLKDLPEYIGAPQGASPPSH